MAEPLHLPEEQDPGLEQIRLGENTVEVDPTTAAIIRQSYESLAAQYGAALEDYRRQALQTVGTPHQAPAFQPPQAIPGIDVPNPDLLFQNKDAWSQEFGNSIEGRIAQVEAKSAQMSQGLASAFQQELNRRDAAAQAQQRHDAAMAEMLERRGLQQNTLVVQAVYNREYDKLKHLPLELGLDKIGAEAELEIQKIRSGESWELGAAPTQTGVAPRPPAMLRSARRASRAPTQAPAEAARTEMQSPNGSLGPMGMVIRKRQEQLMRGGTA
jgi:hypothetical protein